MAFPQFDGTNINEAVFCDEFLSSKKIIYSNRAFFTPDGRVTDDLPLRGEIFERLKCCAVNNIPRKVSNILEVMKLAAQCKGYCRQQKEADLVAGRILEAHGQKVPGFGAWRERQRDRAYPYPSKGIQLLTGAERRDKRKSVKDAIKAEYAKYYNNLMMNEKRLAELDVNDRHYDRRTVIL